MENLTGKTIVLGICGGIAAYKIANVCSLLKKSGADVHVIMTNNATKFISPLTFETLSNNRTIVDTFDRNFEYDVKHVSLAKAADLLLIAPASANVIAKLATGICDDFLTTTALACTCKKMAAPAMNTAMLLAPQTQNNLRQLKEYGYEIIECASGRLACGDCGLGKLSEPQDILAHIERAISREKDLKGKHVLITAGPTKEAIDPVRFITNHSSGKMGYALAKAAMLRGAEVTLISGEVSLKAPEFVKTVYVRSAGDMFLAVKEKLPGKDALIMSAAVADYTPKTVSNQKIKKKEGSLLLELEKTDDILSWVKEEKAPGQLICGFSMETENLFENSKAKLEKKGLDMIVANNLNDEGAGFGTSTNKAMIITKSEVKDLPLMSKEALSNEILDCFFKCLPQ